MSEKKDLIKQLAEQGEAIIAHSNKKYPEWTYMFECTNAYWQSIYEGRENGVPIILTSPNVPQEMIYALGAIPFPMDSIPTRLASGTDSYRYVDIAEQWVPSTICSINKINFGSVFSGDLGFIPAAMVFCSLPCDSSRTTYPAMAKFLADNYDVPCYMVDTPYRKDAVGFKYTSENLKEAYEFIQNVIGVKHDKDRLAEFIIRSNKTEELLVEIGNLRRLTPCPLESRLLAMNGLVCCSMGSQFMLDFCQKQYEIGKERAEKGIGVTPGPEKFRVAWLQNLMWNGVNIMDWMEKKYNAVSVMNSFGFQGREQIEDPYDDDQVWLGLAERCLSSPMVHAVCGPAEKWLEVTDHMMRDYNPNVGIYGGHVGCKHAWAAAKLTNDIVEQKYNVPVLTFDGDFADSRYKPQDEVKKIIADFLETLDTREAK